MGFAAIGNVWRTRHREQTLALELRRFGIHTARSTSETWLPQAIDEVLIDENLGTRTDGRVWVEIHRDELQRSLRPNN
ncbi:MAG: hypothetical protein QM775_02690 [Pirellulales bacterium]